ncbi:MAG: UDP-glucose 4-epimerase GalE [Oscillospiraceae bacterium]|nr:UDP-glucose 4-epimerase GalE [Oscillospiraceae bacterium]
MSRILVTGGAGYIGSHTVCALIGGGAEVAIVDNLETGHEWALHPEARFYRGDIRDAAFLDGVLSEERAGAVVHFAANSLVAESMENPLKYYHNNVEGTRSLLGAMVRHGVESLVFSSTAAVYGEPERVPILESDRTGPSNPYGETKLAMERMIAWAARAHGLRYASLRYFNAAGAHPDGHIGEAHTPETHLIPLALQAAAGRREALQIYGTDYDTRDGTCIRDYLHITDLAQAHLLALEYLLGGGESDVFNLGNGVGFTVREVITAAEKAAGRPIPAVPAPRRPGDPERLVASGEKARRVLGWEPRQDLEAMCADAWRFEQTGRR